MKKQRAKRQGKHHTGLRSLVGMTSILVVALLGCKGGKAKTETLAALDKHRLEYGKCELMAQMKETPDGKAGWLGAAVCRAKHRSAVMAEVSDSKKFDEYFEEWKKEKGPKAIEDARSAPATAVESSGGSGGDCPNGAACLNRCKSECEGKHGALMDLDKMRDCTKSGGGADCVTKATNQETRLCFFKCRGLPPPQ